MPTPSVFARFFEGDDMHLGRFHYFISVATSFLETNQVLQALDSAIKALQTYQGAPTLENNQLFRQQLEKFRSRVTAFPKQLRLPSARQFFEESSLGADFPAGLAKELDGIIQDHGLLPQELLSELSSFRERLKTDLALLERLNRDLGDLQAEYESVIAPQIEFGLLFPHDAIGVRLDELTKELAHVDRLFKAFNELRGKGSDSPVLRTISSSWWQFFFDIDAATLAFITVSIERITAFYRQCLEIRKLRVELKRLEVPEATLKALDDQIETRIKEGIATIAADVRKQHQQIDDQGRANELEVQMKLELLHVAKRLDQGMRVEVRVGLPKPPDPLKPEQEADEKLAAEHAAAVELHAKALDERRALQDASYRMIESIDQAPNGESLQLELDANDVDEEHGEKPKNGPA